MATVRQVACVFVPSVICFALSCGFSAAAEPREQQKAMAAAPTPASLAEERKEVKDTIELWQNRVHERLRQIESLSKQLDLRQINNQKIAVDQLRLILNDLDEEARLILEAETLLAPDLRLYRDALNRGPAVFEKMAIDFERLAAEKKTLALKESYLDFAGQARNISAIYAAKAKGVDGLEAELVRKMGFVRESREFIKDIDGFLAAIPTDSGIETQKLVKRVNDYIQAFDAAMKTIKGVGDQIGRPEQTQSPLTPTQPTPQTKASKSEDSSTAALRRRLAALN